MFDTVSIHLHAPTAQRFGLDQHSAAALVATLLKEDGRVLKSDERSDVRLHHINKQAWVVKRYGVVGPKLWLYRILRSSRGWREWRGALRLNRAGIRGNEPLALILDRSEGRRSEALVLPFIPGSNVARWLSRTDDCLSRNLVADQIGRQIGQMASAGIINRDHKATNVIVDDACETGEATPIVIDPAGLRMMRHDGQVFRMLALLYGTAGRYTDVPDRLALRCLRAVLQESDSICAYEDGRLGTALMGVRHQLSKLSFDDIPEKRRVHLLAHQH